MVCANCGNESTTAVKGVHFCLNCGHKHGDEPTPKNQPVYQEIEVKAGPKAAPKQTAVKVRVRPLAKRAALLALHPDVPGSHLLTTIVIAAVLFLPIIAWPALSTRLSQTLAGPQVQVIAVVWLVAAVTTILIRLWLSGAAVIGFGRALDRRHITKSQSLRVSRQLSARVLTVKSLQVLAVAALASLVAILIVKNIAAEPLGSQIVSWITVAAAIAVAVLIFTASAYAVCAILADNHHLASAYNQALKLSREHVHRLLMVGMLSVSALALPLLALFGVFALASWSDVMTNLAQSGVPLYLLLGATILLVAVLLHFALMFSQFLWLLTYQKISRS